MGAVTGGSTKNSSPSLATLSPRLLSNIAMVSNPVPYMMMQQQQHRQTHGHCRPQYKNIYSKRGRERGGGLTMEKTARCPEIEMGGAHNAPPQRKRERERREFQNLVFQPNSNFQESVCVCVQRERERQRDGYNQAQLSQVCQTQAQFLLSALIMFSL